MEKKTKALAAIAAGALAIGIALSVASCALRSAGTDQQTVQEEAPAEEAAQGQGAEAPAALTSYELACSKGWKSDAGSLQMSKGMVIEKGADGKIHVLTVSEVEEADAGKQAVLTVAGTDEDSQDSVIWTLIFDRSGGAATMSSDDFKVSKKYSEDVAEGSVSVSGMDEAYIGLVGGDAEPLRKALAAFCAAMLWLPQPAHADIADTVNSWLCGMLRDFCNWIFGAQVDVLRSIGAEGVLSASFETMLGGSGTVSMYDIVHGVWESAILPIGCGVLSFVFTVQLIKISQRMDGSSSMPAVKEVVFLLVFFAVLVAYIVALVVSWARAIQLYLMAAFSPIPLSLMGLEDTRQIGIGYLRSFASVCLAGVIILVILVSFPVVLGGLDAVNAGTGTPMDSVVGGLSYALQYLAVCVLLILSLVKSGAWARDVMGG